MICGNCKNKNERIEIFNNLSLEVNNKEKVQDSLKFLIQSETISDYKCDKCNEKVEL